MNDWIAKWKSRFFCHLKFARLHTACARDKTPAKMSFWSANMIKLKFDDDDNDGKYVNYIRYAVSNFNKIKNWMKIIQVFSLSLRHNEKIEPHNMKMFQWIKIIPEVASVSEKIECKSMDSHSLALNFQFLHFAYSTENNKFIITKKKLCILNVFEESIMDGI